MRSSRLIGVVFLLLTLVFVAGCRKKQNETPSGMQVGLSLADGSGPYAQAVERAVKSFAEKRGFAVVVEDAHGKASEQTRAIEQFIQKGVSSIIVRPVDAAKLASTIKKANAANIYVVAIDETVPAAEVASFIEPNQTLAGQLGAEYLGQRLPSGGSVAVITAADGSDERERLKAFKELLQQKHPSIKVVEEVKGGADEAGQRAAVERVFARHKTLSAVFALTDPIALHAADALRAKSGGKCFVISYGGLPQAVEEIKKPDSPLAMTIAAFPQSVGTVASRGAWRIVTNRSQPSHIQVPVLPVTKDNYGSYPGWTDELPRSLAVPWPSELSLETKRDDS